MKILIIGHRAKLTQEVIPSLLTSGFVVAVRGRPDIDICQRSNLLNVLEDVQPDLVINAAGYTAVDKAETEPEVAFAVNRDGVALLAETCAAGNIPLIHLSTDYVFSGESPRPYTEEDPVGPLGVYGLSKWEGEQAIRNVHPQHIIIRASWFYGIHGTNILSTVLDLAREREELRFVNDQQGCPTWTRDLASALTVICERIKLLPCDVLWGTYHYCGAGQTTWYEFAKAIIDEAREHESFVLKRIEPISSDAFSATAPRPKYSVLDCVKIRDHFGISPPPWQKGLRSCLQALYKDTVPSCK